jgi:arylsulfatase A-like enzyme
MPFDQVPERYKSIYRDAAPEELAVWENLTPEGFALVRSDINNYFAMISGIDEQFGRLLAALEETGIADDTIVVFTSDHGDMMGSHGEVRKGQWYNESLLVPFLVRYPNTVRSGVRDDALLSTVDIYPTLLGLLGLGDRVPENLDGIDCSSRIVDGRSATRDAALYLRIDHLNSTTGSRGLRTERHTYAVEKRADSVSYYCYDNAKDPEQMSNLRGTDRDRDEHHREVLASLLASSEDPFAEWIGR